MNSATLIADPAAIHLDYIRPLLNTITLVVKTREKQALCPCCQRRSSQVHSRYIRCVADLPWHGVTVKWELHTRRFRCRNNLCTKRIFCERLPRVVAHYARKTMRLNAALELIGFALGGEAGARLARELGLTASPIRCSANFINPQRERLRHHASSELMTLPFVAASDMALCL
jgi:hypothetical protein